MQRTLLCFFFFIAFHCYCFKIKISDSLSIQFYKPQLIANVEWPDKFVFIESNFAAGDLGSSTYTANNNQNTATWNQAYVHSSADPAVSFAFPINNDTITNLGTFTIPPNKTFTTEISSNYSHFYEDQSTHKLSFNTTTNTMIFSGMPYGISSSKFAKGLRFGGAANVILNDGSFLQSAIVYWGGNPQYEYSTSIISFQSNDLINWNFLSIIANASQYPDSEEGPNEHDLTYLADGKTLMSLIRLDAGDGPTTHSYKYYSKSLSSDQGKTWSKLQTIEYMGCARPRLRLFKMNETNSVLLASGGRMRNDNTSDILLWINEKGDGMDWSMMSISYIHNKLLINDSNYDKYAYDKNVNSTTYSPRETNSYTSLISWKQNNNDNTANGIITYDKIKDNVQYSFSMNFMLQSS